MELIDQFHKDGVIDAYTFVFDEMNPDGSNTMLALSEDGFTFSQWTSGVYDPEGHNEHLGRRVLLSAIGDAALNGFFARLSIPQEWEEAYTIIEQIIREDGDD
jgi:photosystem II stability/assembly factor-like uncharacterized protein